MSGSRVQRIELVDRRIVRDDWIKKVLTDYHYATIRAMINRINRKYSSAEDIWTADEGDMLELLGKSAASTLLISESKKELARQYEKVKQQNDDLKREIKEQGKLLLVRAKPGYNLFHGIEVCCCIWMGVAGILVTLKYSGSVPWHAWLWGLLAFAGPVLVALDYLLFKYTKQGLEIREVLSNDEDYNNFVRRNV